MAESTKTRIAEIQAPYGRLIRLDDLAFDSGMKLLRVTIREGARYTILEIDAATAQTWADQMAQWSHVQGAAGA